MNRRGRKGRILALTLAAAILLGCCGSATAELILEQDTEAILPDGEHRITLPAGMISLTPDPEESDLKGIFLREPDLEMLVYAYDGQGSTVRGLAKALREAGRDAEVRRIGGGIPRIPGPGRSGRSALHRIWISVSWMDHRDLLLLQHERGRRADQNDYGEFSLSTGVLKARGLQTPGRRRNQPYNTERIQK